MVASILNLLYPSACEACGIKTHAWNQNICGSCYKKIKKRQPPFCIKCGKELPGSPEMKNICNDCKKACIYFDRAASVFHYDDILKNLVHSFKYKKTISLAKEFSDLAVGFMEEYSIGMDSDMVLSIPMHPFRLFKREINPSEILAKNIAKKTGLKYSHGILKKIRNTTPQSRLARNERIHSVKNSFSLRKNKKTAIRNKNILLVDDLFTTGSTVNECAKVLKEAGSRSVEVITLARGDRLT